MFTHSPYLVLQSFCFSCELTLLITTSPLSAAVLKRATSEKIFFVPRDFFDFEFHRFDVRSKQKYIFIRKE